VTAKEAMSIFRGLVRPWIAILFTGITAVVGTIVIFKLLPATLGFIDRDIALVIIVAVLGTVTMLVTATAIIMGFYFGERATKKAEEK